MTNFYIDPIAGSDAAAGAKATPWKTLTFGATAVRIAPGDEIRIKKSSDPVSLATNLTLTDNSVTGTLAAAKTVTIDNCESVWISQGGANVTPGRTASGKLEGVYCGYLTIGANFTTGLAATSDFAAKDLSGMTHISGWIKSSINLSASDLSIVLDDTEACGSPVETIVMADVIKSAYWYPFLIPIANPANCTAIISLGLVLNVDRGACTLYFDNIIACTINLNHRSLIGFNDGYWWPIRSIVETTIKLGGGYSSTDQPYGGVGGTATGYTIAPTPVSSPWLDEWQLLDSGNSWTSLISIKGGWDFDADVQNGYTFMDCLYPQGSYTGFAASSKDYFYVDRLSFVRGMYGFYLYLCKGWEFNDCQGIASVGAGFYTSVQLNSFYNKISSYKGIMNVGQGLSFYNATGMSNPIEAMDIDCHGNNNQGVLNQMTAIGVTIGRNWKMWSNATYGVGASGGTLRVETMDTKNNVTGGILHGSNGPDGLWLHNFTAAEATKLAFSAVNLKGTWPLKPVMCTKYLGVVGDDRIFYRNGTVARDSANQDSGTSCLSLTPATANVKLIAEIMGIAVIASTVYTATLRIKKSAGYNGNNPRVCWTQNGVFKTAWESKTVTTSYADYTCQYTPSETGFAGLLIDCDGTAGAVYVDTVSIT